VKASIDAATARDNEIAQLRAELQAATERERDVQKCLSDLQFWKDAWYKEITKRTTAEKSVKRLEEKLHKQLSQMTEREQEAIKKLEDLKECLRQPGKEARGSLLRNNGGTGVGHIHYPDLQKKASLR
jgi:predicted  nucleic acid-binding Zn-ribbon protein